ncbi:MAG: undecaprenyldiphospho-muramoylpentapeptide beta-N-acetylglucosaminyltransferase [Patescibacteria group bacterium]
MGYDANKIKKILLTGGGTGGSVTPLLAVVEKIRSDIKEPCSYEFLWLGTRKGPEREMVKDKKIKFISIANGKLRRYFSIKNLIDPFFIIIGFFKAIAIILVWRPNLVMSAGSFVSVPVIWAAWLLRVPVIIHQQDIKPGLANKLMAPCAKVVTVTFRESLDDYGKKAVWTGNPVAPRNIEQGTGNNLYIKKDLPILLVVGGGTGSEAINKLVWDGLEELAEICQIIHITGRDKNKNSIPNTRGKNQNYKSYEFLEHEKIMEIMMAADLVISRAGLGLLTELSYLGKAAIIIPIPDSHQEENARIFQEKEAAKVLDQISLTAEEFISNIKKLIFDNELRKKLSVNISQVMKKGANQEIVKIIKNLL